MAALLAVPPVSASQSQQKDCPHVTINAINNRIAHDLDSLVNSTFFRYFKINMHKGCPFWNTNDLCFQPDCAVEEIGDEDEIPLVWRSKTLSDIDFHSDSSQLMSFSSKCTYSEKDFCSIEDDSSAEGVFVNLRNNPERFTGYAGEPANRIWASIYNENCFELGHSAESHSSLEDQPACFEKHVFYKIVSGLHASVSTHICHEYLDRATGTWVSNASCYQARVGRFPARVDNIYFTYQVLLRALHKLQPYLSSYPFCTSSPSESTSISTLVNDLVSAGAAHDTACPSTFDENRMFRDADGWELKAQFKDRFRNVSRIMDCVGCEKCRLWGKLQVSGLGTALKILFEYADGTVDYRLTRNELVALFNTLFRFSESLRAVEYFDGVEAAAIAEEEKKRRGSTNETKDGKQKDAGGDQSSSRDTAATAIGWDDSFVWITSPRDPWTFVVGFTVLVLGVIRTVWKSWDLEEAEKRKLAAESRYKEEKDAEESTRRSNAAQAAKRRRARKD
ncbi:endoplasmic reticulum Oxidoreductin 1-domain-containing protein [Cladochytrium replicatum]|nr:endoplasmic reticulum Oxidoreductin 1-domain-containing protein [Cladochytrium replicatum]